MNRICDHVFASRSMTCVSSLIPYSSRSNDIVEFVDTLKQDRSRYTSARPCYNRVMPYNRQDVHRAGAGRVWLRLFALFVICHLVHQPFQFLRKSSNAAYLLNFYSLTSETSSGALLGAGEGFGIGRHSLQRPQKIYSKQVAALKIMRTRTFPAQSKIDHGPCHWNSNSLSRSQSMLQS